MYWQIQTARSFVALNLPYYDALRRWSRRRNGYPANFSNLGSTLADIRAQVALLQANGLSFEGRSVLEVGSGWFPVVPLIYRCLGAREVVMTDINRYMDEGTLATARDFVVSKLPELAERLGFDSRQDWLREGGSFEELGLRYIAPFDPGDCEVSVEVITSRTVLEHIPPKLLARISRDWHRILAPDGFMIHSVDHSDHRQHADRRLSRIDFLTWSETGWDLLTRLGKKQWRLRHSDYHRLFGATGWRLVAEETLSDPETIEAARQLPLRYPYDVLYAPEELGIVATHYLLRPSGA